MGLRASRTISFARLIFALLVGVSLAPTALAETTEEAAFDVFLGNQYRGLLVARYSTEFNSTWIEVTNPKEAISLLPALKNPEMVIELLSGRIDKERSIAEVGSVLVSPKAFTISITLEGSAQVGTSLSDNAEFLTVDETFSFRQDLNSTVVSGDENAEAVSSFTNLSLQQFWLVSDFAAFSRSPTNLQEMSANSRLGRYRISAGGLKSLGDQLLPSFDLYGLSVNSISDLLPLDRALRGSNLKIFVPVPGRVQFLRDGLLLDSQVLTYGVQEIDTTRFPDGSYFIDIVYPNSPGNLSRERRYFSRSGLLVPRGYPAVSLSLGELRDQFERQSATAFSSKIDWRATEWMQLTLGSYGFENEVVGITGFRAIFGDTVVGASVSTPAKEQIGYSFILTGALAGLNFSGSYERSSLLELPLDNPIEISDPVTVPINLPGQRERFLRAGENYNFSIGKRIDPLDLTYEINGTKDELLTEYYYHGPVVRWQILETERNALNLQVSRFNTDDGVRSFALFSFQHRFGSWQEQVQVSYAKDATREDRVVSNYLNHDSKQQRSGLGTRAQVRNEIRAQDSSSQANEAIDFYQGFRPASVSIAGQRSDDVEFNGSGSSVVSTTLGTTLTVGADGSASLSPSDLGQSLVVAHLMGRSDEIEMEILIDDTVSGVIRGGGAITLGISSYIEHRIRIRPTEDSSLVSYDTAVRKVSANPGAVVHLTFGTERIVVVLGRLVDEARKPLSLKRIVGAKESVLTERDGHFQIELNGKETLHVESEAGRCEISLGSLEHIEYFVELGEVICKQAK